MIMKLIDFITQFRDEQFCWMLSANILKERSLSIEPVKEHPFSGWKVLKSFSVKSIQEIESNPIWQLKDILTNFNQYIPLIEKNYHIV